MSKRKVSSAGKGKRAKIPKKESDSVADAISAARAVVDDEINFEEAMHITDVKVSIGINVNVWHAKCVSLISCE